MSVCTYYVRLRATRLQHGYSCRSRAFSTKSSGRYIKRRHSRLLPDTPIRARFAPSPTGYLHLGSLRTALFNYLAAKATNGQFILRVEDTDQKRTVADAEQRLYEDLKWAGLQWDEGPDIGGPRGPYRQSERSKLYVDAAEQLVRSGHAYHCFCSADRLRRLAARRKSTSDINGGYDRKCVNIDTAEAAARVAHGDSYVVRLRMPDAIPEVVDMTYGTITSKVSKAKGLDDPILLKSDGLPTYHLANVVDDHDMEITHVIRAEEWLSSTAQHLVMYKAFGWAPPTFAHVSLLTDNARQKLSKRMGSSGIGQLREDGIFPEALVNHLALLGWSHRVENDFLPMADLISFFDLQFTKGTGATNAAKLDYLQKKYANLHIDRRDDVFEGMVERVKDAMDKLLEQGGWTRGTNIDNTHETVRTLLLIDSDQYLSPTLFAERHLDLFCSRPREKMLIHRTSLQMQEMITNVVAQLELVSVEDWQTDRLKSALETSLNVKAWHSLTAESRYNGGPRDPARTYLRWALYGGRHGLNLPQTMALLGRGVTFERLESADSEARAALAGVS